MIFFSTFEKLLIKRFLFSKKTDGYISIFSWFSVIGISVGVAAIIIVMSVMNGFRLELTERLLGINGHINIYSFDNQISKMDLNKILNLNENYHRVSPSIQTQALIIRNELSQGVILRGYEKFSENDEYFLKDKIIKGSLFDQDTNQIVIGYALANKLKISIGDKVKIAIPKSDKTIFGNIPRFKTLKVSGFFNLGMYEYDSTFVFTNASISRKLLLLDDSFFNKIEIFTNDPENIENLNIELDSLINKNNLNMYTLTWKENNAALINALKVEKNVMFLILTLIIVVASMNIISGQIIFVKEKNKDIGILKTIGINNFSLIKIFMFIGLSIGFLGTFIGSVFGILFSVYINSIQTFFEKIFDTNLFSKEIYYLSNLPSNININEVVYVILIAIIICLFATLFPAFRSSRVDPIKSLKND